MPDNEETVEGLPEPSPQGVDGPPVDIPEVSDEKALADIYTSEEEA